MACGNVQDGIRRLARCQEPLRQPQASHTRPYSRQPMQTGRVWEAFAIAVEAPTTRAFALSLLGCGVNELPRSKTAGYCGYWE